MDHSCTTSSHKFDAAEKNAQIGDEEPDLDAAEKDTWLAVGGDASPSTFDN
jgi:hypothetical protein